MVVVLVLLAFAVQEDVKLGYNPLPSLVCFNLLAMDAVAASLRALAS